MTAFRGLCAVASVLALVVEVPAVAASGAAPLADADIAVLTPDGVLTVYSTNGLEVGRVETGTSWPKIAPFASDRRVVVLDDEAHRAVLVDTSTGRLDSYAVPDDASLVVVGSADAKVVAALSTYGSWSGAVLSPSRGVGVDLGSVEVQRLFDEAPLFEQWSVAASSDGAMAVITDYTSGSSLVVSFVGADPFVVPGAPVGFSADYLVTQHSGPTAMTLRYFATDGTEIAEFDSDAQGRRGLLDNGELITLDEAGTIFRLSPRNPQPEMIGSVELAGETIQYFRAFRAASRLVIGTNESVWLLTTDGALIGKLSPVESFPPSLPRDPLQRCVTVGDRTFTTFDIETGTTLSALAGSAVNVLSDDGCTVLVTGSTGDAVVRDGVATRIPDGESLLAASRDARLAVLFGDHVARIVTLERPDETGITLKLDDERVPRVVFLHE